MKRKHTINCYSEIEMDRCADALLEQGYKVERQLGVMPVQQFCIPTYKVIFWGISEKGRSRCVNIGDGSH